MKRVPVEYTLIKVYNSQTNINEDNLMPEDKHIYLFIYDVHKQAVSNLDSILVKSNCRKICEHRLGRNADWNGGDVFQGTVLLVAWKD